MPFPKIKFFFAFLAVLLFFGFSSGVFAFVGPGLLSPGTGGGLFKVDANNNIGFGTASPTPASTFDASSTQSGPTNFGYVFVVASTSNPGIGIKNLSGNGNMYLWSSRNFGNLQLYRESATLPGLVVLDVLPTGEVGFSTPATTTARLSVGGSIQSSGSFIGNLSGSLSAANVTGPSAFGSNYGTYSYAFPGALAVGTSTVVGLQSNSLFVNGNVGIATTTPALALTVQGTNANESGGTSITNGSLLLIGLGTNLALDMGVWGGVGSGIGWIQARNRLSAPSAEALILQPSGGKVGIGTSTPYSLLSNTSSNILNQSGTGVGASAALTWSSGAGGYVGAFQNTYNNSVANGVLIRTSNASANILTLNNSGTDVLTVLGSGNVGIGTSTPPKILTIYTDNSAPQVLFERVSAGGIGWQFKNPSQSWTFGQSATNNNVFVIIPGTNIDGTTGLFINTSGNVGIATTTPGSPLTVAGAIYSSTGGFKFPDGTTQTSASVGGGGYWALSGSNLYPTSTSYNVGIGTTTPQAKLNVYDSTTVPTIRIDASAVSGNDSQLQFVKSGSAANETWTIGRDNTDNSFRISKSAGLAGAVGTGDLFYISGGGNVGIATTTPQYTLSVVSPNAVAASFNQPIIVGTPTAASHAATKNYVDSVIGASGSSTATAYATSSGACNVDATCEMNGANLSGGDILGVGKLTVTTIDPLYMISGSKYSTYAASIAGGVKEEYVGRGVLSSKYQYSFTLDFDKVSDGSDLWVWYKAVDFNADNVEVFATPIGVPTSIAYEIKGSKITFTADIPNTKYLIPDTGISFSYRLIGKRFDWREWPTYAKDQSEEAKLIVK